jgi:transposase InsO family protein
MRSRITHHPLYHLTSDTVTKITGDRVEVGDLTYEIIDRQYPEEATLRSIDSGEVYRKISLPTLENRRQQSPRVPDESCSDTIWFAWLKMKHPDLYCIYEKRRRAIEDHLLYSKERTPDDFQRAADKAGVKVGTMKELLRKLESGAGERALVPKTFSRGPLGKERIDPRVKALVDRVIARDYLNKKRVNKYKIYLMMVAECKSGIYGDLKPPSHMYVYRKIAALDPRTVTLKRLGRRVHYEKWGRWGGAFSEDRFPLNTVEVDHQQLDVYVEYEDMLIRPWLTMGLDVYSRVVWGYYLGISAPTDDTDALLIRMGVLPKTNKLGITLKNEWPVYGLPANFFTDNGRDFRARLVDIGCASQGIMVKRGPIKVPNFRGHIERAFETLKTELIEDLPGRVFPITSENKKVDYDPKEGRHLTLPQLEELLVQWVVDDYHITPHSELGGATPLERWNGMTGKDSPYAPQLPSDLQRFQDDFLSPPKDQDGTRTIREDGTVELYNEVYIVEDSSLPRGVPLPVRFNPEDMSRIKLLPNANGYVTLRRRDGPGRVSLEEIEYLNRQLNNKMKRVPEIRAQALMERRARIKQLVFLNNQEKLRVRAAARRAEVGDRDSISKPIEWAAQEEMVENLATRKGSETTRRRLTPEESDDE